MDKNISERILLLTDVPPCKNYTGGLMTSKLARFLLEEKKQLSCFCVMSKELSPDLDMSILNDIEYKFFEKPHENFNSYQFSKKIFDIKLKKLGINLVKYIKKNKITKVWGIVQGEVMLSLLDVVRESGIEYVAQVWDPIEWWMKENKFTSEREIRVMQKFGSVLASASCCMTSSFAMSKEYHAKYGTNCVEVMSPIDKSDISFEKMNKNKNQFVISISGQIYSKEETSKFLEALKRINWKYKEKEIIFRHYGMWTDSYIDLDKFNSGVKKHVQVMGFLPQHELLRELSSSDLLYCPYFFSHEDYLKNVAVMSFPSKLITYMASCVPILVHAPSYASPYLYIKSIEGGFLEDTLNIDNIISKVKLIIDYSDNLKEKLVENSKIAFLNKFTSESVKDDFFYALGLDFKKIKKLRILEVNNVDLPGRRFNGFDLLEKINNETIHSAKQIVTYKTSKNPKVVEFFKTKKLLGLNEKLIENEAEYLSVHSQLSFTSNILMNHDDFINADLVHYHLIHNTKFSLSNLINLCSNKPSVLTIHDPWNFTGRCVHPNECEKWKSGCKNCEYLDNLFPLKEDNCNSLWKLKKIIYQKLDVDIVVTTPFIKEMIQKSPLTKHFNNIHLIPFGLDLDKFSERISKRNARIFLHIKQESFVIFFRSQAIGKGIGYIIKSLKELRLKKDIVLLTCGEIGLLDELKNRYSIIEMGFVDDEKMVNAYCACDIFLMPSEGESFGLMAIEAMACSRPVIVFNNSALPYVTFSPECGVLVENKNSHKLMEAIKMLVENKKEREKRGKLGRKLAEENYDVRVYEKRIVDLYEKAYKRQKNKKKYKVIDTEIDYSLPDVQILIKKLKIIFYNLFDNFRLNANFSKYEKSILLRKNYKIDYSLDSVQNVLTQFNDYIYNLIKDENKINLKWKDFDTLIWYKKVLFLFKNDRDRLKDITRRKLSKYKLVYFLFRTLFRILRRIKRTMLNHNNTIIINRLNDINTRLDYLDKENRKIMEEIAKMNLERQK